jgi:NADH-quinone oxidoreductase subunit E
VLDREVIRRIQRELDAEEGPRTASIAAIRSVQKHHGRAACIAAMRIVQRHRGYVSDQGLQDMSELLGMSVAELESVATFYSLVFREPVGEHVILLCDSVSCWVMGQETVLDHLERRLGIGLGETTADGRFTLLAIPCLGACDRAPAMLVGETLYGPLTPDSIDGILDSYGGSPSS